MYLKMKRTIIFSLVSIMIFCVQVFAGSEPSPSSAKITTSINWSNADDYTQPIGPTFTGSGYLLEITLKDADGNSLPDKEISWDYSNVYINNRITTTDSNGMARNYAVVSHNDRNIAYTANITITFSGDDTYALSRYSIPLQCYDIGPPVTPVTSASPTLTPLPTNTPMPSVHTVSGYIFPQRTVAGHLLCSGFTVTLLGTDISTLTQKDGSFSLNTVLTNGKLRISKPGYLAREVQMEYFLNEENAAGQLVYTPIEIFAGDINQDNTINISDIMLVAKYFNSQQGDENFNEISDLNKDLAINISDIMMAVKHFNKTSFDYPDPSVEPVNDNIRFDFTNIRLNYVSTKSATMDMLTCPPVIIAA